MQIYNTPAAATHRIFFQHGTLRKLCYKVMGSGGALDTGIFCLIAAVKVLVRPKEFTECVIKNMSHKSCYRCYSYRSGSQAHFS